LQRKKCFLLRAPVSSDLTCSLIAAPITFPFFFSDRPDTTLGLPQGAFCFRFNLIHLILLFYGPSSSLPARPHAAGILKSFFRVFEFLSAFLPLQASAHFFLRPTECFSLATVLFLISSLYFTPLDVLFADNASGAPVFGPPSPLDLFPPPPGHHRESFSRRMPSYSCNPRLFFLSFPPPSRYRRLHSLRFFHFLSSSLSSLQFLPK